MRKQFFALAFVVQHICESNGKDFARSSSRQSRGVSKTGLRAGGSATWRNAFVAVALVSCAFLVACGGSMNSSPTVNGVPMSITIGDTPPSGVAVLFFEALITGASLQPSDMSKSAVPLLTTPVEVEFGHLQTDRAFLSLANVPPGTYKSLNLTFGNAVLTIVNHSGAAISSCADNSACQLTPNFNPLSTTVSSAAFPITVDEDSAFGIRLDFNVNSSVQSDLSINPTVTVANVTHKHDGEDQDEMEEADDVDGQVTVVGTSQFTLMNERSGQSFTVNVDSNTEFEDFDSAGCTANPENISCVKAGQIVEVDLSENGMGTMLAKRVKLEEGVNEEALKGTITTVDSKTRPHMVVFNEEPTLSGVSEGAPVVVAILSNASFGVSSEEMGEQGGFTQSGLSFASAADLIVGQDVQIRPQMVTSGGGATTITTDRIRLRPSQITGQVGTINSDGTFTLTGLSPLFTGATPPITSITVELVSEMRWEDVSGLSGLAAGNTVSVKGLLFNTSGSPTLLAKAIRKQ